MKTTQLILILFVLCNWSIAQTTAVKTDKITIGEKKELYSALLHENRILNVYLPYGYDTDSNKTYPVVYVLDGSIDEDFIHLAGIVQFASFSWIEMIPESIVVGIANVDRKRDFTYPSTNPIDQKEFPTSGKSSEFIRFIEKEVQPFIDSTYRTANTRTIVGQSLGGLLATEILFKKPELFDNYIIVSPSLWWDDEKLLTQIPNEYNSPKSIYIAVGKEGETMERIANELYNKLKKNQQPNSHMYFEFLEDKTHGDALHLAVYHAFEKIFRAK